MVFKATILHCKAMLGGRKPELAMNFDINRIPLSTNIVWYIWCNSDHTETVIHPISYMLHQICQQLSPVQATICILYILNHTFMDLNSSLWYCFLSMTLLVILAAYWILLVTEEPMW